MHAVKSSRLRHDCRKLIFFVFCMGKKCPVLCFVLFFLLFIFLLLPLLPPKPIQVALHACGVATDMVMEHCVQAGATFVISPCCYGFIQNAVKFTFPKRWVGAPAGGAAASPLPEVAPL